MPDNTRGGSASGTNPLIASDEVSYSGDTAAVQLVRIVNVSGAEGSRTVDTISDGNGLKVVIQDQLNPIAVGGDGVHDVPAPTGVLQIGGYSSAAIPSDVSADGDIARLWATRKGILNVRIVDSAGTEAITGGVAHDAVDAGNPFKIGGFASGTGPTAVATGDRVNAWFGLLGQQMAAIIASGSSAGSDGVNQRQYLNSSSTSDALPVGSALYGFNGATWDRVRTANTGRLQVDAVTAALPTGAATAALQGGGLPSALASDRLKVDGSGVTQPVSLAAGPRPDNNTGVTVASATAQYTTTQTSTVLGPTVGAAQKMVVTSIQIQGGGTTAGAVQVYFGTGAYSRGTNRAVFDGEFAPSATNKPGYAQSPAIPYEGPVDAELRVTTSAGITLTVTVWYYLV